MDWRIRTVTLCALALVGAFASAQPIPTNEQPVAVVNGVAITMTQLRAALDAADPVPVPLPAAQQRQRQAVAIGLLVDAVLLRQFLDEQSLPTVTPEEVKRRLDEMKAALTAQKKSFEEFLDDTRQTEEQLKVSIADHIRWSAYLTKHLTDDVLAKYHTENRDFFDQASVEASHIALRIGRTATQREKDEARAKLKSIREALLADPKLSFAEMARQHSQDSRAAQGGELGVFPRRSVFDESFSKAAFALKEGEISDIVETDYGLHLIKVTKRHPGTPSNFAEIKEVVRGFCGEDRRQEALTQQRQKSKIEINLP